MATLNLNEALYVLLAGTAALTALTGTRIYKGVAPDSADMPRLTYFSFTEEPKHAMSGDLGTNEECIQVDVWAETYSSMVAVSNQVKAALRDYNDTVTSGADSLVIKWIYFDDSRDFFDDDPKKRVKLFRKCLEFTVWY